jgi:hypothetical protein
MKISGAAEKQGIFLIPRIGLDSTIKSQQGVVMRTVRGLVLIALVCVTSLAVSAPAFAQNVAPAPQQDTDQGVGIGVLGGLAISSFRGEGSEGTSSGTGPMFGIWFGGNRNGRVGFMGELSYVQSKVSIADDTGVSGDHVRFDYLEIPALFRINIGSQMREGASVYALAGPVFDFQLSKKLVVGGVEVPEAELENQFTSVNIGLMIGGGFEWNRIGVEVRGNWGMKQLATDEAVDSETVPPVKGTMIQIVGKFRFN